jgi:putative addiction module component (TIGR02574 family)
MSAVVEQIKSSVSQLTGQERAELALFFIESLDTETDADAEEAWDAELARRMDAIRQGTAVGEPADLVLAELRRQLP